MTLETLYSQNWPIVYGYLLSLSADPSIAEELAAETFLRAIQKAGLYDGTCKPSTWLCAIARNLYFNERRRQKRNVPLDDKIPAVQNLEQQWIDTETARTIYHAAKALPEPYRQVFFLRLGGMSFRQIGIALDKSENWARVTYFRGKTKIQKELEDQ